jgi:hypothetical protein
VESIREVPVIDSRSPQAVSVRMQGLPVIDDIIDCPRALWAMFKAVQCEFTHQSISFLDQLLFEIPGK